jgi:hypothetical protein
MFTAVVLFCFGCVAKLMGRITLSAVDSGVGCQWRWVLAVECGAGVDGGG